MEHPEPDIVQRIKWVVVVNQSDREENVWSIKVLRENYSEGNWKCVNGVNIA